MKHTKRILLTFAMTTAVLVAMAQDVTVIHMKDGSVKRYLNGIRTMTSVRFFNSQEQIDAKGRTSAALKNDSAIAANANLTNYDLQSGNRTFVKEKRNEQNKKKSLVSQPTKEIRTEEEKCKNPLVSQQHLNGFSMRND